jgi:predicted O-methyltransferase YrrM
MSLLVPPAYSGISSLTFGATLNNLLSQTKPHYSERTSYTGIEAPDWFPRLLLSVTTVKNMSMDVFTAEDVLAVTQLLEPDDYLVHVRNFYKEGIKRFGDKWRYADIMTTLSAATALSKPKRYMEIGVRRGRSMAIVASKQSDCEIYGFDMWVENYAGMPNPGTDFVQKEMKRVGHKGKVTLISGDSHETLPAFFKGNPDITFDLITVDGDHSEAGAAKDIEDVLPYLSIGGMIVFDDICHPAHPELIGVWNKLIGHNPHFASYTYEDLGFGVALGIRKRF